LRPLIGIPTRTLVDGESIRYGVLSTYTRAADMAGGVPIAIPLNLSEESLRDLFSRLDGLLLAGGVDVHPNEYGEEVAPFCGDIDISRDATELTMTRWALAKKMPILGICRGIQLLNIAAGGSLYQDIPAQLPGSLPQQHVSGNPYNFLAHSVEIDANSRLARALGATQLQVNSLHHQSLKQIAPGFQTIARAPDGIIEGIESTNGNFALGVQFHPEWLVDDDARMVNIFRALVEAINGKR
jgi:putative glutamine amidotransferase